MKHPQPTGRIYYGWWVVVGLFVVLTISSGFGFYNLSVYVNVLAAAHGFSMAAISGIATLFFVVGGVAGMAVAQLLERFDVRKIMLGGAALGGLSLGLIGSADSLGELYVLFALFGVGNAGVSIVVSTTLVTQWFPGRNRSVALSVASTGLSMGGILITPLSAVMINWHGLYWVMPWAGLIFFAGIAPIAWWVLRLGPPRSVAAADHTTSVAAHVWTYRDAIRTRFFILHTTVYVFCMGVQVGGIAHLYNHVETQAGLAVAAVCVQVLTAASILGRITGGFVVTRVSIRGFTLANLAVQAAGLGVLSYATEPLQLLVGAGLFGSSIGNLLMLQPLWLAHAFDGGAYARIFSLANAVTVLGVGGGPLLLGALFDWQGYGLAYFVAMAVSGFALVLLLGAGAGPVMANAAAAAAVTDP